MRFHPFTLPTSKYLLVLLDEICFIVETQQAKDARKENERRNVTHILLIYCISRRVTFKIYEFMWIYFKDNCQQIIWFGSIHLIFHRLWKIWNKCACANELKSFVWIDILQLPWDPNQSISLSLYFGWRKSWYVTLNIDFSV